MLLFKNGDHLMNTLLIPPVLGIVGMLAALGRSHEFKIHFRGALNNGISIEELKDVLLQIILFHGRDVNDHWVWRLVSSKVRI